MGLEHGGILTIGVAVAALALAGCGGDDDGGGSDATAPAATAAAPAPAATTTTPAPAAPATADASDPVARAATVAAAQKGGLAVSMKGTILTDGRTTTVKGKGKVNRSSRRGSFTISTSIGAAPFVVREVMDGYTIYLTSKLFNNRLPGKRSWMKIDLAKAAKTAGFDPSSLGTNGPSQDPSQVLDYLEGAGPSKKVGTAKVRGVPTTRYRVDVDLKQAIAKSRTEAAKNAIDQLAKTLGDTTTIPVDVWVDSHHRVLRERVRYSATLRGKQNDLDFTTDFTGFGVPVSIDPPPASDVVDGLQLLQKSGALQDQQQQQG